MSHPEQLAFFAAVADANKSLIAGGRILEVGSYDVNGSVRSLFANASEYVGVDLTEGPGVDVVGFGHEVDHADDYYDVTISGECFEHDPHWRDTFANMVRMTRPGGIVAFTCASRGRPEHGTRRTAAVESPGTQAVGLDYYCNLTEADFAAMPLGSSFKEWRFWYMATSFDLYFAGVKSGGPGASLPGDDQVEQIRSLMSVPHRLIRLPLRVLAVTKVNEQRYQDMVFPYWRTLLKATGRGQTG